MGRQKGLGELERLVLEYLWAHGPSTTEAVRAAVTAKDRPLTDSTIRTVLRRLEAKDFARHEIDGRQFLYSAAREPGRVATDAVRSVIKTFCRGSLEELLTGLVDHRVVDSAELRRLAAKIAMKEQKRRKS